MQATTAGNPRPGRGDTLFTDELAEGLSSLPGEGGAVVLEAFRLTAGLHGSLSELRAGLEKLVMDRWRLHYEQIVAQIVPVMCVTDGRGVRMPESMAQAREWYQKHYVRILEVPVGRALASWQPSRASKTVPK